MSFTIEVESDQEGTPVEYLSLTHRECTGGGLKIGKIKATKGKKYKNPHPKDFLQLGCVGCFQKIWIEIQEGEVPKITKTAVDGQDRTLTAFTGELEEVDFREFDILRGEEIEVEVVQK